MPHPPDRTIWVCEASQANDASIRRWSVFVAACFFCSFWVMVFSHFLPCSLDKIESSSITLIFFQPLLFAPGILIDYEAFPPVFALLTFKFKVFRHGDRPGRGEVLGQQWGGGVLPSLRVQTCGRRYIYRVSTLIHIIKMLANFHNSVHLTRGILVWVSHQVRLCQFKLSWAGSITLISLDTILWLPSV